MDRCTASRTFPGKVESAWTWSEFLRCSSPLGSMVPVALTRSVGLHPEHIEIDPTGNPVTPGVVAGPDLQAIVPGVQLPRKGCGDRRLFATIDLGEKRLETRGLGVQLDLEFAPHRSWFESEVGLVECPFKVAVPRDQVRVDRFGRNVGIRPDVEPGPGPTCLPIVERQGPSLLQEIAPRDEPEFSK